MNNDNNILKMSTEALINEIYKIQEYSLLDKILSYCDNNDLDLNEIAEKLQNSEQFKKTLWIDCTKNNIIKDDFLKDQFCSEDITDF